MASGAPLAGGELPPISTAPVAEGFAIATTAPDELLRHNISDEELDMLCESRSDGATEGCWVALGALAASAPAALPAMLNYHTSQSPMGLADFLQIIIFWIALVVLAVLFFLGRSRGKSAKTLKAEIRNRRRTT